MFLTNTGTAANGLALSALVEPHEVIYCQQESHINTDECGAPEFYTNGAKLLTLAGEQGKISVQALQENIAMALSLRPHKQKPGCISITQATEYGTVYTLEELAEITNIAKKYNLPVHLDGARFANSVVSLKESPDQLIKNIDVMSFGATKNGAMCAEAVKFFNLAYAEEFDYRQKRAGQLMSKSRFFASQFLAYLANDLWLNNAIHANTIAQKLKAIFQQNNISIAYPVEINELFVTLNKPMAEYLRRQHVDFYAWGKAEENLYRLVTSCFTSQQDIENFAACLRNSQLQT